LQFAVKTQAANAKKIIYYSKKGFLAQKIIVIITICVYTKSGM